MDSYVKFKFHFEKKPDEIIEYKEKGSILELFTQYSRKIQEKANELIYCYKGSIFRHNICNKNKKFINEIFDENERKSIINIFAFSLKKVKKLSQKTENDLTSSNKNVERPPSIEIIKNEIMEEPKNNQKYTQYFQSKIETENAEKKTFNDIVCPKCETSAIIENDGNLRLKVINCENFHRVSNLNYDIFEEFEENLFDMSVENQEKLKCNTCSIHKINITPPEDNQFYICSCGSKLCKGCFITHENNNPNHYKFEIENKNYKCFIHGKEFNSYCIDCNMNICELCYENHLQHEILKYQHLKPRNIYIEEITNEVEKQKNILSKFVENSEKILIDVINSIKDYINKYIKIENTLLNRYKNNFINFQLLQNIRNKKLFYDNDIFKKLSIFNDNTNINNLTKIYEIIRKAKNVEQPKEAQPKDINIKNQMNIKYKIPQKNINRKVKIFDPVFVENNKTKCYLVIDGNNVKLCEYYNNLNDKTEIDILLIENDKTPITNMSYMFNNCKYLDFVNFESWNTINVTNMESLFQLCPIKSIPDISKWNTTNLINMRAMFSKCINLNNIPQDIVKLNTYNVKDMSLLFNGCISLTAIPNLQKWDTRNLEDMSYMFSRCIKLKSLHGIGKWNTKKVKNMSGIFNRCEELTQLPDISSWDLSSTIDISIIFQFCIKLEKLPDISKWKTNNLKDISGVFSECNSLKEIPNIGRWNTAQVICMCGLFNECNALTKIPDISKWNTEKVTDMSGMFCGCSSITQLPNLSNWKTGNVADMSYIFDGCSDLKDITPIKNWNREKVKDKTDAFRGCPK